MKKIIYYITLIVVFAVIWFSIAMLITLTGLDGVLVMYLGAAAVFGLFRPVKSILRKVFNIND